MLHEFQKYVSDESIEIVFHFNGSNGVWVQSLAYQYLCYAKNAMKGSRLVAQTSFSSQHVYN